MLDLGNSRKPALVCHRGGSQHGPENSLRAATTCFDLGYEFVEIDLQTSKDAELMVAHDATVDRVFGASGAVADMTLAQLRALRYVEDPKGGPFGMPMLAEMLSLAGDRGGFMVELKQADPAAVVEIVRENGLLSRCFFWSFDLSLVRHMRAAFNDLSLMARRCDYETLDEILTDYHPQVIEFDPATDDLAEIARLEDAPVKIMLYLREGTPDDLALAARHGPDLINTDRPDRFTALRHDQAPDN